jgi:hypothetical protein
MLSGSVIRGAVLVGLLFVVLVLDCSGKSIDLPCFICSFGPCYSFAVVHQCLPDELKQLTI